MEKIFTRKNIVIFLVVVALITGGFFLYSYVGKNKQTIVTSSLNVLDKISGLLPIPADEKKELAVVNQLVQAMTQKDGKVRSYLILMQNNMELRPGGGFLGQYAIVKTKDGEVTSVFVEDANLLDQRINVDVPAPYPFQRMLQLKKWKFRDSNFSPDFPTNVDKAKYFMRLAGSGGTYDGVFAINAQVLNDVLEITGPVTIPGTSLTYTSADAALKLEEQVEKPYILNENLDTQNRKAVMKRLAPVILDKLLSVENISKLPDFAHREFKNKNIMLNFSDENLQKQVENVYWDGKMAVDWKGDYLMMVDSNMGALKSDYFVKRSMKYDLDLTVERPVVTLNITYNHTATYGDWRTSDYHSYLRIYVPEGAKLLERQFVNPITNGTEFGKTYFGFKLDAIMNRQTTATIKYELPDNFPRDNYQMLIQKQSGAGDVPVDIHVKTAKGDFNQSSVLVGDLKFEIK